MPSVVFTIPPLASVGMQEKEARVTDLGSDMKILQAGHHLGE
jgi:pyruvate/2-oxoglutarate dehydrogenase complex dihydrolipoamide dehydrogenase (E3) component